MQPHQKRNAHEYTEASQDNGYDLEKSFHKKIDAEDSYST